MRRDPLGPVSDLGRRQETTSAAFGIVGALLLHVGVASGAATSLMELSAFVQLAKAHVLDRLLQTYDIELDPPKPPEPEPEPPPPPPEPETPPPVVAKEKLPAQEKPAAAEAAKILAAEPDPNAPLDLTDQGFVSGTGEHFAGGITSSSGTSKVAVRDTAAQGAGTPGSPTSKLPEAQGPDRSRIAKPASMEWRDCPFPAQAEIEQIDYGRVSISVTVAPDGRALKVTILSNPGYGFGQAALNCAMRRKFLPALNRMGQPITQNTPPISVTFTR